MIFQTTYWLVDNTTEQLPGLPACWVWKSKEVYLSCEVSARENDLDDEKRRKFQTISVWNSVSEKVQNLNAPLIKIRTKGCQILGLVRRLLMSKPTMIFFCMLKRYPRHRNGVKVWPVSFGVAAYRMIR